MSAVTTFVSFLLARTTRRRNTLMIDRGLHDGGNYTSEPSHCHNAHTSWYGRGDGACLTMGVPKNPDHLVDDVLECRQRGSGVMKTWARAVGALRVAGWPCTAVPHGSPPTRTRGPPRGR